MQMKTNVRLQGVKGIVAVAGLLSFVAGAAVAASPLTLDYDAPAATWN